MPPVKLLTFLLSRRGCIPYATQLLSALSGFDHRVYTSAFATENPLKDTEKIKTYRNGPEAIWRTFWELPRLLYQLRRDRRQGYRVAYFPTFHHWNLPLLFACRQMGIRTIYTVHNAVLHAGEDHWLNRYWQRHCMQLADELICLTQYVEQQSRRLVGPEKPIHHLPHGLLQLPGLAPRQRSLPQRPRLLFLGRVEAYKGINLLFDALSHLPAEQFSELIIAGRSAISLPVYEGAIPIQLIDRRLSEVEMATLLSDSDILILPYTEATQSGILTLAISAALPTVCTHVGGLPEQLAHNEAVWVSPTASSIADGIRRLATDAALYQDINRRLIAKSRDTAWTSIAARLQEIIYRLHR